MANGDRINAIKQDWLEDSLTLLRELSDTPALVLPSLNKMTSNDLSRLHSALIEIKDNFKKEK